jgi:HlyD family secretion protein
LNWIVSIPNTKASDYIAKYNAYQTALQTQTQTLATTDAAVQQAESNLNVTAAAARPEDVASAAAQVESAKGALQVAQAAYDQYRIVAPSDGTITAVHVSAGQTATANAPAIEMSGTSFAKSVPVSVPNSAIITNNGKTYVRVKSGSGTIEKEVTTGIHDASTTEIVSGLSAGDQVAVQ